MVIAKGDKIKVDYVGTLEDGTEFDSSQKHGQPLEFEVGAGQIIKGFDEAVIGMQKGEQKTVTIAPQDAYGEKHAELQQQVPRSTVPEGQEVKEGMMVAVQGPDGRQMPATITAVTDEAVTLDLNHPLAGKTLTFAITIVEG